MHEINDISNQPSPPQSDSTSKRSWWRQAIGLPSSEITPNIIKKMDVSNPKSMGLHRTPQGLQKWMKKYLTESDRIDLAVIDIWAARYTTLSQNQILIPSIELDKILSKVQQELFTYNPDSSHIDLHLTDKLLETPTNLLIKIESFPDLKPSQVFREMQNDFKRAVTEITILKDGQELPVTAIDKDPTVIECKKQIELLEKRAISDSSLLPQLLQKIEQLNIFLKNKPDILSHQGKWLTKALEVIEQLPTPSLNEKKKLLEEQLADIKEKQKTIIDALSTKELSIEGDFGHHHQIAYALTKDLGKDDANALLRATLFSKSGLYFLMSLQDPANPKSTATTGTVKIEVFGSSQVKHSYTCTIKDMTKTELYQDIELWDIPSKKVLISITPQQL